ncbi:MAG: DUF3789 domain-containing protein [Acutalibacteraceae bacterium]
MGVLIFFVGVACGAFLGIVFMCCLQIGRVNEYRRELERARRAKQ